MEDSGGNDAEDHDGELGGLDDLRREIEDVDGAIVDHVARRMYVVEEIAEVKDADDMEIEDREREREVVERAVERAEHLGVDADGVREVFDVLIEMSKQRQRDAVEDR